MRLRIFTLITLMSFVSVLQAQKSVLTAEKLWKLGRVSDVKVSPDGSKVLYGVTRYDL